MIIIPHPVPITRATKIYALCAAVNSCNLGYDIGVNTNAGVRVQQDFGLSDTVRSDGLCYVCLLACLLGALLTPYPLYHL